MIVVVMHVLVLAKSNELTSRYKLFAAGADFIHKR
jgi:hypothetical protein